MAKLFRQLASLSRAVLLAAAMEAVGCGAAFAVLQHRTYVSQSGADSGECRVAQPCFTVAYAVSQTVPTGVLTILDDGDFYGGVVDKSITIQGNGLRTRISAISQNDPAILVNAPSGQVYLRNLTIEEDFSNPAATGIQFEAGLLLSVEDVSIRNYVGGNLGGIFHSGANASNLHLKNVHINNCGFGGAVVVNAGSNLKRIVIDSSQAILSSRGILIQGSGNVQLSLSNTTISGSIGNGIEVNNSGGTTRLTVKDSQISGNTGNGVMISPTGAAKVNTTIIGSALDSNVIGIRSFPGGSAVSNVSISDTSLSNNAGGLHASGKSVVGVIRGNIGGNSSYGIGSVSPAAVRIGGSMVNGNALGLSGPVSSYGNNQLLGNTTQGSSTPIAPGSVP